MYPLFMHAARGLRAGTKSTEKATLQLTKSTQILVELVQFKAYSDGKPNNFIELLGSARVIWKACCFNVSLYVCLCMVSTTWITFRVQGSFERVATVVSIKSGSTRSRVVLFQYVCTIFSNYLSQLPSVL